jgi:phosphoenolpyruvate carboxykinase (ATP)
MVQKARSVITNPDKAELRSLVAQMPTAQLTEKGNLNVITKVRARSAESTFFVSDRDIGQKRIQRNEFNRIVKIQDDFISRRDLILVEGCIGPDSDFQISSKLYVEKTHANIAAMQQQLFFPPSTHPNLELEVIFTPNLYIKGYPNGRVILVDIENYSTRVIGSDYFGESKKAGLRMWNDYVFNAGGLAIHAGCKIYPDVSGQEKLALIIGLSGTGKTATTFKDQLGSLPAQDDFCALLPGGLVRATENGCFAKTYGLNKINEPVIYKALTSPQSYLENVMVSGNGKIDFNDGKTTTNGRGTFELNSIKHYPPINLPNVNVIILLNRNENIIPAVVKLKKEQAAAYFMLGETTGTSAGGANEMGKFLRVPGTNPFFCNHEAFQGNRFYELLKSSEMTNVYLFNTGSIGGKEKDTGSKKVTLNDSSKILEGIIGETIKWKEENNFGYLIADEVPNLNDEELLNPEKLYVRQNRAKKYYGLVKKIKEDRKCFLDNFKDLYPVIKESI